MSLNEYKKKRDFEITSEPQPVEKSSGGKRIFVVQRHQASHLHFDFRLEEEGVLKSWAVPKGPSMNPTDKRLAVMVEDHPLDYAGFEGNIPEGEYGAGVVEIWDNGTWQPERDFENVGKALEDGVLEFYLSGNHLNGKFALVKVKFDKSKNNWLLIKKKDGYAVDGLYDANEIRKK